MRKIKSRYISSAFFVTAILQGYPAHACDASFMQDSARKDTSIYSKWRQGGRELIAVMDGRKPRPEIYCRLARKQADLEREYLDNVTMIRAMCPAIYASWMDTTKGRETVEKITKAYELTQELIGSCAQKGL